MKRFFFATLFAAVIALSFVAPVQAADPTVVINAQRDRVTTNHIDLTSATETTLIAAGGVGVFRDLVLLVAANESATEVLVLVRDATAGSVVFEFSLPGGGSLVLPLVIPLPQTAANNNWTIEVDAAVTSIHIMAMTIDNP